jgi:cytoskeletal protein CcmA (bactofilin family)
MSSPARHPSNPVPPPSASENEKSNLRSALPAQGRAAPVAGGPDAPTSTFSKSLVIKGEVSGSEPLQIEGRVEGSIALSGNYVSIGRDGVVAADIIAQEVAIRGTLRGNLTISDRVEIYDGGSVVGDVSARRISIEDGAHFQGGIDMRRTDPKAPLESDAEAAKPNPWS